MPPQRRTRRARAGIHDSCLPGGQSGRRVLPDVRLHLASDPEQVLVYGINGARTGDTATESSDRPQPPPKRRAGRCSWRGRAGATLLRGRGGGHVSSRYLSKPPPFHPIAVAPAAPVPLGTRPASLSRAPEFSFLAPTQSGEWVVRVELAYGTSPDRTRRNTFFRLRVDVPPLPRPRDGDGASRLCASGCTSTRECSFRLTARNRSKAVPVASPGAVPPPREALRLGRPIVVDHGAPLKMATGGDLYVPGGGHPTRSNTRVRRGPFEPITDVVPDYLDGLFRTSHREPRTDSSSPTPHRVIGFSKPTCGMPTDVTSASARLRPSGISSCASR